MPQLFALLLFSLQTHPWIYQGAWGRVRRRSWPRRVVHQHLIIWGWDPTLCGVQPTHVRFISNDIGQIEGCVELLIIFTFFVDLLMLHKHKNELYSNYTRVIIIDLVGFTIYFIKWEWEHGTIYVQDTHVDVVANSTPINFDEMHLGNQMAVTFIDAF
jgi:hypothetical protein